MNATTQKWIMGIIAAFIIAVTTGSIAWAQTVHSDIAVLQTRTLGIDSMRDTLEDIRVDVAAIRGRNESRDAEIERRLDRIERAVNDRLTVR